MSVIFSFDPLTKYYRKKNTDGGASTNNGFSLEGDNGRTLFLIHGLTGTPNEMRSLANYFNRKGYSIVCPNLANHGEPIWVLKYTKWQEFYASVKSALSSRLRQSQDGPVFIAGLSMGAILALLAAEEFPDRISAVSCLAPTLFYDGWNSPDSKFFLPLGQHTFLKYFFYFKEEPPYGIKNEAVRERVDRYYSHARLDDIEGVGQYGYPYFPVTLLCELQSMVKYVSPRLKNVKQPLQLIQAKDDDVASIKNSKFIYDRIRSIDKEMVFIYDSYHVITADQERGLVAEKMEDFFEHVIAGKRG